MPRPKKQMHIDVPVWDKELKLECSFCVRAFTRSLNLCKNERLHGCSVPVDMSMTLTRSKFFTWAFLWPNGYTCKSKSLTSSEHFCRYPSESERMKRMNCLYSYLEEVPEQVVVTHVSFAPVTLSKNRKILKPCKSTKVSYQKTAKFKDFSKSTLLDASSTVNHSQQVCRKDEHKKFKPQIDATCF